MICRLQPGGVYGRGRHSDGIRVSRVSRTVFRVELFAGALIVLLCLPTSVIVMFCPGSHRNTNMLHFCVSSRRHTVAYGHTTSFSRAVWTVSGARSRIDVSRWSNTFLGFPRHGFGGRRAVINVKTEFGPRRACHNNDTSRRE